MSSSTINICAQDPAAHTYVNDSIVVRHRTQNLEATQSPFSALADKDRTESKTAMDRPGFIVDEGEGVLNEV